MPDLETIEITLEEVVDQLVTHPYRTPSPFHATAMIDKALEISGGKKKNFNPDDFPGVDQLGHLWEFAVRPWVRWYVESLGWKVTFALEMPKDGIILSLDGIAFNPQAPSQRAVIETKSRWTPKYLPTDRFRDMSQVKSYCYAAGTTNVWMPVLRISSTPPQATVRLHVLNFSQVEIAENWEMMMNTKREMEKRGTGDEPLLLLP